MAVDRGGLQYSIQISDQFSRSLSDFSTGIKQARIDLADFKKEAAQRSQTTQARDTAATSRANAKAASDETKANQANARALSVAEAAQQRYAKAVREGAIARQVGVVAAERSFTVETKVLTPLQARQRAEAALSKILSARADAEARVQALQERGVALTDQEAKKFGTLDAQQASSLRAREQAEAAVNKILDARQALQARLAAVQSRGIDLSDQEKQTLGLASLTREEQRQNALREQSEKSLADVLNAREAVQSKLDAARRLGITLSQQEQQALGLLNAEEQRQVAIKQQAEAEITRILNAREAATSRLEAASRRGIELTTEEKQALGLLTAEEQRLLAVREQAQASISRILTAREQVQARLDAAQANSVTLTEKEKSQLGLLSAAEEQLFQAKTKLQELETRAGNKEALRIETETEALRRKLKAEQDAAVSANLQAQGLDKSGKPVVATDTLPQSKTLLEKAKEFLGIKDAANQADSSVNRVSFTFRRLFGILAAFTAVRLVGSLFKEITKEAILFNAQLEQTALGIAGIISATGDVRDAQGKVATGADRFAISLGIAREQVTKLRGDALLLTTDVNDLAEALNTGLAFGLQNGFNVDQVRKFTREIALAGQAIGLQSNQLTEEIRSILTGTINPRNTRIASVLGITNEDVRQAKETGTLFDFLQTKLASFNTLADKTAQSLPGLFGRLKNELKALLGEGALPLAADLKTILSGVVGELVKVDKVSGDPVLSPDSIEVVRLVFQGLREAVAEAGKLKDLFTFEDARRFAGQLGQVLAFVGRTIADVARGATAGVETVLNGVDRIRVAILAVTGIDIFNNPALREAITLTAGIVAALLTISAITAGIGLLFKGWALILGSSLTLLKGLSIAAKGLNALQGVTLSLKGIVAGINLAKTGMVAFSASILPAIGSFLVLATAVTAVVFALDQLSKNPILNLQQTKTASNFAIGLKTIGDAAKTAFFVATQQQNKAVESVQKYIKETGDLVKEQENLGSVSDAFGKAQETLAQRVTDLYKKAQDEVSKFANNTEHQLDGLLLNSSAAIDELRKKIAGITDEIRQAQDAARIDVKFAGVSGDAREQAATFEQGRLEAAREAHLLDIERVTITRQVAEIQEKLNSDTTISDAARATAQAKIIGLTDQLNKLDEERLKFEGQILRIKSAEALAIAANAEAELRIANASLKVQGTNAGRIQQLEAEHRFLEQNALQTKQDVDLAVIADRQAADQGVRQLQLLTDVGAAQQKIRDGLREIAAERALTPDESATLTTAETAVATNEREIAQMRLKLQLESQIRDAEIKRLERLHALAELAATNPIGAGLTEAFHQVADEAGNAFQQTINIAKGAVQGLASVGAQAVASMFDPQSNFNLREALGRLLLQIATSILEQVFAAFIANVLLATVGINLASAEMGATLGLASVDLQATGVFWATLVIPPLDVAANTLLTAAIILAGTLGAAGAATGGHVADVWAKAKGYAAGGIPNRPVPVAKRPRGLDPRDRVPIWADPQEWIIRGASVFKYGHQVMSAINEGLIDPLALKALAGVKHTAGIVQRVAGPGMAEGGPVRSVDSARARAAQGTSGNGNVQPAVIAPTNEAFDRLLAGGRTAMLQFLGDHGFEPVR